MIFSPVRPEPEGNRPNAADFGSAIRAVEGKFGSESFMAMKAKAKPKTPKGPGVISTILECIENAKKGKDGVTFEQILSTLVKKVKGREKDSMNATIKAQIGSSKRPLRMEREKKITFEVVDVVVNKGKKAEKTIKHFSLKSKKK